MKRAKSGLVGLLIIAMVTPPVFGWISPLSKKEIAAAGPTCIAGFHGNLGHLSTYHVGDAEAFENSLDFILNGRGFAYWEQRFDSRKIVLHSGTPTLPSYASKEKKPYDWQVSYWPEPFEKELSWKLQIDVWTGGKLDRNALKLPKGFEVQEAEDDSGE